MTQEEKQLLLIDLCARLPYHPILNWKFIDNTSKDEELKELSDLYIWWITKAQDCRVRPYLRPMSSMTKEERLEFSKLLDVRYCVEDWKGHHSISYCIEIYNGYTDDAGRIKYPSTFSMNVIDWLNSHHFDYRGLIEKGLALEAPEGMYK